MGDLSAATVGTHRLPRTSPSSSPPPLSVSADPVSTRSSPNSFPSLFIPSLSRLTPSLPPRRTPIMAPCAFLPTVSPRTLVARPAATGTCRHVPAAIPAAHGVRMLMGGGKGNEAGGKNPFGALGNMGNIMDAVKKAQQFTESAKELQDELKEVRRGC